MSTTARIEVLIRQDELEQIAFHRREMSWHKLQLEPLEKDVMHLLVAGAETEIGRFNAKLKYMHRHNIAWRSIVVSELGSEFANAAFKSSPMIHIPKLEIVEHPPDLPLFMNLD